MWMFLRTTQEVKSLGLAECLGVENKGEGDIKLIPHFLHEQLTGGVIY